MQILEIEGFEVLERNEKGELAPVPVLAFGLGFLVVENPLNPAAPPQLQFQWCALVFDESTGQIRASQGGNRIRRATAG